MLPTNNSVPIENVVVNESGDDSEDEWNYIKVDKEKPEEDRETPVILQSEQETDQFKEDTASPTTPPPPPTATFTETDFTNQESHALAQTIAQPEEAGTEVCSCSTYKVIFGQT